MSAYEEVAIAILSDTAKDLRLIEAICLARMARPSQSALRDCLVGLDTFLKLPGDLQKPNAVRQFERILERICSLLGKHELPGNSGTFRDELQDAISTLLHNERLKGAGHNRRFQDMQERLTFERETAPELLEGQEPPPSNTQASAGKSTSTEHPRKPASAMVDQRTFKRQVGEVADLLFLQDPASPISYRLRRHTVWMDITAMPPLGNSDRTIIPAISPNTTDRYQTAIDQSNADDETILRLERALFALPFWFDGHYMASNLARIADRTDVADAIQSETQAFVTRLPAIIEAMFDDGCMFAGDATRAWLETRTDGQFSQANLQMDNAAGRSHDLPDLQTLDDHREALLQWNGSYKKQSSLRNKAVFELMALDMLRKAGLTALASDQAERLSERARQMSVTDWDQEFFQQLQNFIDNGRG